MQPQKGKREIVDALVLAFSHSGLSDVVGSDALRLVLDAQYVDLMEGRTFRIDKLWSLLEEQPGFSADLALPPLCRFMSWQSILELQSEVPPAIEALSLQEREDNAANCPVTDEQLELAMADAHARGCAVPEIHRPAPLTPSEEPSNQKRKTQTPAVENKFTKLLRNPAFAAAIFFVGLSSLGAVLYLNFRTPPRVAISGALGDLPVATAWRQGDQVSIQLKDNNWFSQHRRDQKKALKSALSNPELDGSEAYLVRDTSGKIRTQAFWHIPKGKSVRKLTVSTR